MRADLRWLVAFAGNAFFLWLIAQLNHVLTAVPFGSRNVSVFVVAIGMPLAFVSLRLGLGYALAAGMLTALAAEAGLPVPHGTFVVPALVVVCAVVGLRGTFNRFDGASALVVSLAANLVVFVAVTARATPTAEEFLAGRLLFDLLVSQAFVVAINGWFFAWQLALLRTFGFDLETELRDSP
jgi:hypothetical protein